MKEYPILFSGPMVRAILEGRKTMTRRVCKLLPPSATCPACPYGQPGDRLWVRESMKFDPDQGWRYVADGADVEADYCKTNQYCPSIHMPRWASRITLEVISVRVEKLHKINEQESKAEGVQTPTIETVTHRDLFRCLWDSINAKRGYGWSQNPWVWVIEFRRVK